MSARGAQGIQGEKGDQGIQGPQGPQGNSGYTGAAGELEVVNNLTQGGATAALSAEMGKVLSDEINGLSGGIQKKEYSYKPITPYTDVEVNMSQDELITEAYVGENGILQFRDENSNPIPLIGANGVQDTGIGGGSKLANYVFPLKLTKSAKYISLRGSATDNNVTFSTERKTIGKLERIGEKIVVNLRVWSAHAALNSIFIGEYCYNKYSNKVMLMTDNGLVNVEWSKDCIYRYYDDIHIWDGSQLVCISSLIRLNYWGQSAFASQLQPGQSGFNTYSKTIQRRNDDDALEVNFSDKTLFIYDGQVYRWEVGMDEPVAITAEVAKTMITKEEANVYGSEIPYAAVTNVLINPNYGTETAYADGIATDYIPVEEGKFYYVDASAAYSNALYALYDKDKNFVSAKKAEAGATATEISFEKIFIPKGVAYIKVCQWMKNMTATLYEGIIGCKEWVGKKWVCVGDSLTEKNIRATKNYHDYIAEKTGIEVVNMGVSGTGYKRQEENSKAFYQRILNVPTDADVITIFGSGNDGTYWANAMGSATDSGTDTLGGCINTTLDNLYSVNPLAVVGIVSPTPWLNSAPDNPQNGMSLYTELLREICRLRGIPFLDLFHCSGFRPNNAEYRELVFSRDPVGNATHPNEIGHKLIAPRFKAFLETLIM
jgi:lysophospholipase L1-like esterase